MNHEELAKIVHTVNRAYCIAIGEKPQEPWEDVSDEMKESTYVGINYVLNHPTATASTLHRNWCKQKKEDGWVYGKEKNQEKKTHPCLVPFSNLPKKQRIKDVLFIEIVKALS